MTTAPPTTRSSSSGRKAQRRWSVAVVGALAVVALVVAWASRRGAELVDANGRSQAQTEAVVRPPGVLGPTEVLDVGLAAAPPATVKAAPAVPSVGEAKPALGSLRIRVTEGDRPVEGARVSLGLPWSESLLASILTPAPDALRSAMRAHHDDGRNVETATDGVVTLDVREGVHRIHAWRDDDGGRWLGYVDVDVGAGERVETHVRLEYAVRIAGTVVDLDGAPVAEVTVQAWAATDTGVTRGSTRDETDADGRFEVLGFGREAHVVAVFGDLQSFDGTDGPAASPPTTSMVVEGTRVTVEAYDLARVVVRVHRVERLVLEVYAPTVRGWSLPDLLPAPTEPRVWQRGWEWESEWDSVVPTGAPFYVSVRDGTGCPWYVLRLHGCEPIVEPRRPGGLRRRSLDRGRQLSCTLATGVVVRAFVHRGGDRVEFNAVFGAPWILADAPCEAFDLAPYRGNVRVGPWHPIPAGDDDLTDVVVPIDPEPAVEDREQGK